MIDYDVTVIEQAELKSAYQIDDLGQSQPFDFEAKSGHLFRLKNDHILSTRYTVSQAQDDSIVALSCFSS